MTSNKCLKYNHQSLIRMDGLTLTTFPGQAQTRVVNQYSDGQSVVEAQDYNTH